MKHISLILLLLISILSKAGEVKYITASSLNLRDGAGRNHSVLISITKGDSVKLKSENSGWSKVETFSGEIGFVSSKYLSSVRPTKEEKSDSDNSWIVNLLILGIVIYGFIKVKNWFLDLFGGSGNLSRPATTPKPQKSKPENQPIYLSTVEQDGKWINTYDSNGKRIQTTSSNGEIVVAIASDFYVTTIGIFIKTYDVNCKQIKIMQSHGQVVINAAGNTFTTKKDVLIKTYDKNCNLLNTRNI